MPQELEELLKAVTVVKVPEHASEVTWKDRPILSGGGVKATHLLTGDKLH